MANIIDKTKWELHLLKHKALLAEGTKKGLIHPYDSDTIARLRNVYYGGIPLSIILLSHPLCNGKGYDSATLISAGFGEDDFEIVYGDIDTLKLNPKLVDKYRQENDPTWNYADHAWAERTDKNNVTWVYDTTLGLVVEKSLYYKMERPKVRHKNDKAKTVDFLKEQITYQPESSKYALPLIIPNIEMSLNRTLPWYKEELEKEIKMFKEKVGYDSICQEVQDDIKRLYKTRKTQNPNQSNQ
ncbi:MAG: hypothetical protein J6A52_01400 [Bacilli bacterium]|nr:hypothetical protein [Bacilli bacterium]